MDTPLAMVIAATITGGFTVIVAALNKFRKENKDDHAFVRGMLSMLYSSQTRIERKVEKVDNRLSNHLEFHASEGMLDNGRTVHQNGVEGVSKVS